MPRIRRPTEDLALGRIVRTERRKEREAKRLQKAKERRREAEERRQQQRRITGGGSRVTSVWRDSDEELVRWRVTFQPDSTFPAKEYLTVETVLAETAQDAVAKVQDMHDGEIGVKTVERV